MKNKITSIVLIAVISILFTECYKTSNVPVGYQNSFDDEFNQDNYNWSFFDNTNNASVSIANGLLNYNYYPANPGSNAVAIQTGINFNYNFDIKTSMKTTHEMALVWGVSNTTYGYSFFIDNLGNYSVYNEGDATHQPVTLINWTQTPLLTQNAFNIVELEQAGNFWNGYINGTRVFQIASQPIYGPKTGFEVLADANGGTTGYADYLYEQW